MCPVGYRSSVVKVITSPVWYRSTVMQVITNPSVDFSDDVTYPFFIRPVGSLSSLLDIIVLLGVGNKLAHGLLYDRGSRDGLVGLYKFRTVGMEIDRFSYCAVVTGSECVGLKRKLLATARKTGRRWATLADTSPTEVRDFFLSVYEEGMYGVDAYGHGYVYMCLSISTESVLLAPRKDREHYMDDLHTLEAIQGSMYLNKLRAEDYPALQPTLLREVRGVWPELPASHRLKDSSPDSLSPDSLFLYDGALLYMKALSSLLAGLGNATDAEVHSAVRSGRILREKAVMQKFVGLTGPLIMDEGAKSASMDWGIFNIWGRQSILTSKMRPVDLRWMPVVHDNLMVTDFNETVTWRFQGTFGATFVYAGNVTKPPPSIVPFMPDLYVSVLLPNLTEPLGQALRRIVKDWSQGDELFKGPNGIPRFNLKFVEQDDGRAAADVQRFSGKLQFFIGWIGPIEVTACESVQTLAASLVKVHISFGCERDYDDRLADRKKFPVCNCHDSAAAAFRLPPCRHASLGKHVGGANGVSLCTVCRCSRELRPKWASSAVLSKQSASDSNGDGSG